MGMFDDLMPGAPAGPGMFDDLPKPKPAGMLRKLADKGLGFASGAVGATKAIADATGAGNRVSGALGTANEFLNDNLSAEAKADQQQQSAILDAAKGQGAWEGVKAGARAFGVAPVQTAVQGLGSIVPIIAGTALTGGAAPAAAVGAGIGAAMGLGTAKGAIYDEIKKRGGTDAEATKAQEYGGANTDQIALGGALGAADALTGVSRIAGGMIRRAVGKPVADSVASTALNAIGKKPVERGIIGRAGMGVLGEMPLEAAQGGQEQLAANIAAQRAGYQAGTWDNVASNATLEALASAGPGAVFGTMDRQAPATQPPPAQPGSQQAAPPVVAQPAQPGITPGIPPGIPQVGGGPWLPADPNAPAVHPNAPQAEPQTQPIEPVVQKVAPIEPAAPVATPVQAEVQKIMDATDGAPGPLASAAIAALNTGATPVSQPTISAFDQREADRPRSIEGDIAVGSLGQPLTNRLMAAKAARTKSEETGTPWQPIELGSKKYVIRPVTQDGATNPTQPLTDSSTLLPSNQPGASVGAAPVNGNGVGTEPAGTLAADVRSPSGLSGGTTDAAVAPTGLGSQNQPIPSGDTVQHLPETAQPLADTATLGNLQNRKDFHGNRQAGNRQAGDAERVQAEAGQSSAPQAQVLENAGQKTEVLERGKSSANDTPTAQAEQAPVATDGVAKNNSGESVNSSVNSTNESKGAVKEVVQSTTPELPRLENQPQAKSKRTLVDTDDVAKNSTLSRDEFLALSDDVKNWSRSLANVDLKIKEIADYTSINPITTEKQIRQIDDLTEYKNQLLSSGAIQSAADHINEFRNNTTTAPTGAPPGVTQQPAQPTDGFDSKAWNKKRDDTIKESRKSGAKHLDSVTPSVESMRGREIYNVHDPKEKGVIRTVDNNGNVYVQWSDDYSGKKNSASETEEPNKSWLKTTKSRPIWKKQDGARTLVLQTSLGTTDLKDYVFGTGEVAQPAQPVTGQGAGVSQPTQDVPAPIKTLKEGFARLRAERAKNQQQGNTNGTQAKETITQKQGQPEAPEAAVESKQGSQDYLESLAEDAGSGFKKNPRAIAIIKRAAKAIGQQFKIQKLIKKFVSKEGLIKPGFYDAVSDEFIWMRDWLDMAIEESKETQAATTKPAKPKKKPAGARNLRSAAYDRNPLLTFLATHGLYHEAGKPNSMKSEFSPDKAIMIMGYGPIFKRTGKNYSSLVPMAIQDGYLPENGTANQLYDLIRRAVGGEKINPMYAQGVAEQLAEQSFAEHLAQQQEAAQDEDYDPFEFAESLGFDIDDAEVAGYDAAQDPIKLEVNALLAKAEELGIDTETIKLDASYATSNESEQAYYEAVRDALQAAIEGGNRDRSANAGAQGNARAQEGVRVPTEAEALAALESYTEADVRATMERAAQSEKDKLKTDQDAEAKAKAERIAKEIRARQDASAENFSLGQSAEDSLAGQGSIFDVPVQDEKPAQPVPAKKTGTNEEFPGVDWKGRQWGGERFISDEARDSEMRPDYIGKVGSNAPYENRAGALGRLRADDYKLSSTHEIVQVGKDGYAVRPIDGRYPEYAKTPSAKPAQPAESKPAAQEPVKPKEAISDVVEKIGGARKDTAAKTGTGTAMFSRATTTKPTTVSAIQKAVRQLTGRLTPTSKLGHIVATTAAEIKSTWEPLIDKRINIDPAGNEGKAQAFFDPKTKTIFLIADNIEAGTETAVLAHELVHKHGKPVLGEIGWNDLHSVIESWSNAAEGTNERKVYDFAAERVNAIGAELSSEELFPYAVEAAFRLGIKPNAIARTGTVAKWLAKVKQALREVWDKVVGNPKSFDSQDLVNLAYGVAQREMHDVGVINNPMTNRNVVGNQGGRSADEKNKGDWTTHTDEWGTYRKFGNAVDVSSNWKRFDSLSDDQPVILYHATGEGAARAILKEGFNGEKAIWKNSKAGYVYMGGMSSSGSLGTYSSRATKPGERSAFVAFVIRKGDLEADAGSDWKSYLRGYGKDVDRLHGRASRANPSPVVTFSEINQVRAPVDKVTPIAVFKDSGEMIASNESTAPDSGGAIRFSTSVVGKQGGRSADDSIPSVVFSDIRPPKESVRNVASSLSNSAKVLGNKTVPIDSLIGGVANEVNDRKRVQDLAEKLSKPGAYIERLIVDDAGNVIEGQHRLDALRMIGVKSVPVVVIQDFERNFPIAEVTQAITTTQKMPSDNANQLASHLAEIYADENGDIGEMRQYEAPPGFRKAWEAGISAIEKALNESTAPDSGGAAFSRGTNEAMTNNDVVGKQGGRSADDYQPGGYDEKEALGRDGQYRYQFQANTDGGQTIGNQMRVQKNADGSWSQYVAINGNPERLTRVRDTLNEVLPSDEAVAKGWAIPVKDFNDPKAVKHRATSDSNKSTAPDSGGAIRYSRKVDQTDTPAFKAWFGDSKVVDANGKPLVVYHGTSAKVVAFDLDYAVEGGFFLSVDKEQASRFGKNVMPLYVSMQNPFVVQGGDIPVEHELGDIESIVSMAKDGGHDGVFIEGFRDMKNVPVDTYIAFNPTQIKSATGNNGNFDGSNPDIRFSRAKIVGETTRQHTPEQLRAMKNVGFQIEVPTLKERAQALWKDAGKKLAQGIADQFAPIKDMDTKAYGLMRLAKGASGAFESLLHGGLLKLSDNVYDFDETKRGGVIDKLLMPLQGEHHDFMRWVAANRAERLLGDGKEHLFSQQDVDDLKTLATGQAAFDYTVQNGIRRGRTTRDRAEIYRDSLATFNTFNKNVLDMAEQSGLIDGASRQIWEHEFYVPFYRVADDADGGVRGMNIKGGVVRQQAFKALKGGKNALNADLLDNTLMNWAHLLDASAKNRAAKATIEAAERLGVAIGGNQTTLTQMGSSVNNKNGVVWFMDGGMKRYSLIDNQGDGKYLMTAITALEYAGMRSPIMNAMGFMKSALTIGVTASPFFKIRNLIRDSVQVIGTSGINVNPLSNVTQGWKLTSPKSDAYFRLLAGGGTIHFGTMLEGSEAKRVQALVESGVDAGTILNDDHKVKAFYRKFIEPGITAYNELGNRGEAVNRASLYTQLVNQGMNHAEASLQARDLMDFSMQGSFTSIRFLSQVVPFFNARIQGMYKLGRAAKEDPARFAAVIGAASVISLGMLAAYSDDDDWKRRADWDRNNFWWFKFGDTAFRIPKPFEIGAIATLAERGFELAFDKEMTTTAFRKQVMTLLGDNLSMNPIPQIVKPIIDVYANKDSFSGTPIESMSMERLKSEYRFNDRTSMTARGLSTAANSVLGVVGVEAYSPVQIDHMLRGYFGWLGTFIVGAGDKLARPATGQTEQATPDYWKTATGNMVSDLRDAPSKYVSNMYDQARVIEQAYGTWRSLVKQGDREGAAEFADDNKDLMKKYHQVEAIKRTESKLNERIRLIERSDIDADEKRTQIRRIRNQQELIAKRLAPV